ncbi:glycoside hydrolase family 92 protein [Schizophyllum amplum]|uniref:Glycoside hydrolase family 92 protein n=1 Tax=Schizophyllum amplum TaxID=97359 RepID=A0A550CA79_9AGAR|nr:glycoside hydrolase family 92 protein [Auriculariopsis ampla]
MAAGDFTLLGQHDRLFAALHLSRNISNPSANDPRRHAANETSPDYTSFVNVFIGTDNQGDVCPGASIPFGMAKITTDMTGYSPSGTTIHTAPPTYLSHTQATSPTLPSTSGHQPPPRQRTGASGDYGNFPVMPLLCPDGFSTCTTSFTTRQRYRKPDTDDGAPGYFALTLDNEIKMEATATRRAGLERFTFPAGQKPYLVLDLANDLTQSFAGGEMDVDPELGRVTIGGWYGSSFGPGSHKFQAFACYDLLNGGSQALDEYGVWTANDYGLDAKGLGQTHLNFTRSLIGDHYESGALISYAGTPTEITIRVGVSFVSTAQACANAEAEIGDATFDEVRDAAKVLWNEKLGRIEIDVGGTPANVTEMLYSSLYRANLTPNNATGETQGKYTGTTSYYYDSLYASWDTYRTFYPLMTLTSPMVYAQIVDSYIDGWRKEGWLPETRANNLPGWTQGGSSADNILSHFAVHYHNEAAALGIDLDELYSAVLADGEVNPPEWDIYGRQVDVYKQYGYVPAGVLDVSSVGRQTREASRTLEYAFEDFGIRQVAQLLGHADDEERLSAEAAIQWYFQLHGPVNCSPNDANSSRPCSLTNDNVNGFYESSAWEYAWFAPHDTAHLIEVMGGNDTFVDRLDHFFDAGYYLAGNEPSFQTPVGYHYADRPTKSVDRVREVVFENFGITPAGLPGNDDQAAMASLLIFHLLGLYPVPSTTQLLVLSPFVPSYTVHNAHLGVSTTVTVVGYDQASVAQVIPDGITAYVESVAINGEAAQSRCHFDFYDAFRLGGNITITLTADKDAADDCGGVLPESLSTGGFASAR